MPPLRQLLPKRILVVDDEPGLAELLRLALTSDQFQVEIAQDAQTALAAFEARRHDVVITDFRMPGMDGLELARAIRARCPAQPIILMAGDLPGLAQNKEKPFHVSTLLAKPCLTEELQAAVAGLFPAA